MTSLLIDLVILFLLGLALIYALVLARRIARLQSALVDLAPALQAFCDAVDQSERSVAQIREETDRLQDQADRAQAAAKSVGVKVEAVKPASTKPARSDLVRMFFETAKTRANG